MLVSNSETRIAADLPKGTGLLSDLANSSSKVCSIIKNLAEKIRTEDLITEQGISLLELKNQLILSYLSNLAFTTLLKLSGLQLEDNISVEQLVELRVVLERIRPLENKIKYQVEKYVGIGSSGTLKKDDPLNIKNSLNNIEDASSDEEEQDGVASSSKREDPEVYRPPRIAQMHYPDEDAKIAAEAKRERARALSSTMIQDALQEHTEDPEVYYSMGTLQQKAIDKRRQIESYEEDNMRRLVLSKHERAALNDMTTQSSLGKDLLSFRFMEGFEGYEPAQKRKRAIGGKKKGKNGRKKRKKK